MQQATAIIVNDIGLFKAELIPQFRSFLESKGMQLRDAGAGQYFHVRLPDFPRWMPIERGRAGAPVTPAALRPYVQEFLRLVGELPDSQRNFHILPLQPDGRLIPIASLQGEAKKPAAMSRYLSDLRDDLALNAPISLSKNATEDDLRNHAINRWAYADMMLATRTTQDGD